MGLDMYLTKKTYVKNWDHRGPKEHFDVTVKKGGEILASIRPERVACIEEEVAYWRKANAIHRWFVEHCQAGEDDCRHAYVSREGLRDLLETVKKVLEAIEIGDGEVHTSTVYVDKGWEKKYEKGKIILNPEVAASLLPTQEGFFFGGTDYDEGYIQDLTHTRDTLAALLAEPEGPEDFYYHSSW